MGKERYAALSVETGEELKSFNAQNDDDAISEYEAWVQKVSDRTGEDLSQEYVLKAISGDAERTVSESRSTANESAKLPRRLPLLEDMGKRGGGKANADMAEWIYGNVDRFLNSKGWEWSASSYDGYFYNNGDSGKGGLVMTVKFTDKGFQIKNPRVRGDDGFPSKKAEIPKDILDGMQAAADEVISGKITDQRLHPDGQAGEIDMTNGTRVWVKDVRFKKGDRVRVTVGGKGYEALSRGPDYGATAFDLQGVNKEVVSKMHRKKAVVTMAEARKEYGADSEIDRKEFADQVDSWLSGLESSGSFTAREAASIGREYSKIKKAAAGSGTITFGELEKIFKDNDRDRDDLETILEY